MSISGPNSAAGPTAFQSMVGQLHAKLQTPAAKASDEGGFTERLGNAINDVAKAQDTAIESARDYELGLQTDLAKVMISQQVASLSFQMALNVRNKALGAYKDIMNMPV